LAKGRHAEVCRDNYPDENIYFKTKTKGKGDM
jgi:hypothetical protein